MKLYIKPLNDKAREFYSNHGHFHDGDAGLDLYVLENKEILPGETILIKFGISCQPEDGIAYFLFPRSSISKTPLRLEQIEKINAPVGYLDGPADIHSVNNCFTDPAISLHVYAKPYDSCEIYDIKTNQINRLQMKYHSINGQIC